MKDNCILNRGKIMRFILNSGLVYIKYRGALEAHRYYYPPRIPLPLPTCFHNPTGYPCCNPKLNDLIVETYTMLESKPRFHTCNINAIAQHLQIRAETR
ncbi:unnamed protein product [Meloidogyne enterolobii]|uniref:Uncharacterized protein n=1 Tax=Meloidogyne enterolobii TaxID=390850 RepID=A0ACB1AE97_MELEN